MATISASAVKDLREKTGVGMMDAKKALEEAGGDFEKAVDILRKKGLSAAAKKADARGIRRDDRVSAVQRQDRRARLRSTAKRTLLPKIAEFQQFAKGSPNSWPRRSPADVAALSQLMHRQRERRGKAPGPGTEDRREHRDPPVRAVETDGLDRHLFARHPYRRHGGLHWRRRAARQGHRHAYRRREPPVSFP